MFVRTIDKHLLLTFLLVSVKMFYCVTSTCLNLKRKFEFCGILLRLNEREVHQIPN